MSTWTQWGVRRTWGDVGSVVNLERDRSTAERCAREWSGELVRRTVTADPWTPAEPHARIADTAEQEEA